MPWIIDQPTQVPVTFGCHWPIVDSACEVNSNVDPPLLDYAGQAAIELLYEATGRRYGICSRTIRPCLPGCEGTSQPNAWDLVGRGAVPYVGYAAYETVTCARCPGGCRCSHVEEIQLWNRPVRGVEEVRIDGEVLDPSAYHRRGSWLIRTDGESWRKCQDDNAQAGTEGSWEITYRFGHPVPVGGQIAAGILRCEILKAMLPDERCQLPARFITQLLEDQPVGVINSMSYLDKGLTGLGGFVDLWISSKNPNRLQRRARAYRADDPRRTRRRR